MSKRIHRTTIDETIEATAAAWLAQQDDGLPPEQQAEFARWRSADPRHEAAVARLERAQSALRALRAYRPGALRHPDRDLLGRGGTAVTERRRSYGLALGAGLAAAVLACAALLLTWRTTDGEQPADGLLFAAAEGGYLCQTLADGSLLELNAGGEARVHYTENERRVRLARGEAHFKVAKDPERPFLVEAAGIRLRAVGTAFNVRLGSGDLEVLVTEGRVAVDAGNGGAGFPEPESRAPITSATGHSAGPQGAGGGSAEAQAASADAPPAATGPAPGTPAAPRGTELSANQRLVLPLAPARTMDAGSQPAPAPRRPVLERVSEDTIQKALAWQGPKLAFDNTPLSEAVLQFNRRNALQIELADASLGNLPISGSFRADRVDAFVRLLASGGALVVAERSGTRIVLCASPKINAPPQ